MVETEGKAPRPIEATRAWLDKDIMEGTGVGVVAKDTAGLEVGHKHGCCERYGKVSDLQNDDAKTKVKPK